LVEETGATRILLAMPSASRHRRRAVLERLSDFPVHVQTVPEINDLVSGKARVDDIRDIDVADLLGRDAVPPDTKLLRASIEKKTVMVTGAGGSIGSELCRQILRLGPKCLLLFEVSEIALYTIEAELRNTAQAENIDCEITGLLGSVHHEARVREVLRAYKIGTVYHAAAYKHVPVVEHNILEGIHNNVFGTLHLARAAIDAGVDTFVLISTDKAVSPTSVMGATKRFAEMILQALQDKHGSTCFCMVRFGNVLASSGSVVPLFREQIRRGGPVTVTHREIIRYFMTIPEAAQLVIQAGAMAKGGDVFVLDMGQPVKIRDLARRMINLMGLTVRDDANPDGDIAIKYTGLRPAEKLYEELLIGNDVSGTSHPRIMRATEDYLRFDELRPLVDELRAATLNLDRSLARDVLKRSVAGYAPSNGIEDLVWVRQHGADDHEHSDKVINITTRQG
jgi:FlaA1/EpsC-like NDP-sugar epimerase